MIVSTTRLKSGFIAAGLVALGLMTFTPAYANGIGSDMKIMLKAYKGAMNSSSINEFTQYAEQLQAGANAARTHTFSDDPSTYNEGMQELQKEMMDMRQAIGNNDLVAAKEVLKHVAASKKHYHDLLR